MEENGDINDKVVCSSDSSKPTTSRESSRRGSSDCCLFSEGSDAESNFTSATTEPDSPEAKRDSDDSRSICTTTTEDDDIIYLGRAEEVLENPEPTLVAAEEIISSSPTRPTFEELVAEHDELTRTLESLENEVIEIQRDIEMAEAQSLCLTKSLEDMREAEKNDGEMVELTRDLARVTNENEELERSVDKLREDVRELKAIMEEGYRQLDNLDNKDTPSSQCPSTSSSNATKTVAAPVAIFNKPPSFILTDQSAVRKAPPKKVTPTSRPTQWTSIKQQIHHCLESIPPLLGLTEMGNSSVSKPVPQNKKTKRYKKKLEKLPKKSTLHAMDVQRQSEGFYCVCGVRLTTRKNLRSHIQYFTYEGKFKCTAGECRKRFFSTSQLRMHMKRVHDLEYKGRLGCRKCGQTFLTLMQLYVHCQAIHNCGPLLSGFKKSRASSSPPLSTSAAVMKSPMNTKVVKKVPLVNSSAGNTTSKPDLNPFRIRHAICLVDDEGRARCLCGRHFSGVRYIKQHIDYFSREPKFSCNVCGKKFNDMAYLRGHMKQTHCIIFGGAGCKECGLIFKTRMALNQHCKKFHSADKPKQQESKDGTIFFIKNTPLVDSTASSSGRPKRQIKMPAKYQEDKAPMSFQGHQRPVDMQISQPKLKRPVAHPVPVVVRIISEPKPKKPLVHSEPAVREISKPEAKKPAVHSVDLTCNNGTKCTCGASFTSRAALLNHFKMRTIGTGNFAQCTLCPEIFVHKDQLKKHMKSSHQEATRMVPSPSKSAAETKTVSDGPSSSTEKGVAVVTPNSEVPTIATTSGNPLRHGIAAVDAFHNVIRCICGSFFVNQKSFRGHLRTMEGLPRMSCDVCRATFRHYESLKMHRQQAHK